MIEKIDKYENVELMEVENSGEGGEKEVFECSVCGKTVERVFQQGACRTCLARLFKPYIKLIDDFQSSV